uniref:Restriction endonuclease type IV Mrr domain-containing protein n=1 Tax=Psilocybe cubensis TaxID=181762 RepID=A0A8H7XPL4_PSICU
MSMSLKRVGGKEDGGIDLVGWWWLPYDDDTAGSTAYTKRRRIRVLGQCKAEKKKMGPSFVRELEGVLYRFITMPSTLPGLVDEEKPDVSIPGQAHIPMVALLISESPFTKSALLRAHSSPIPFFMLHLPPVDDNRTSDPESEGGLESPQTFVGPGSNGSTLGKAYVRATRSSSTMVAKYKVTESDTLYGPA